MANDKAKNRFGRLISRNCHWLTAINNYVSRFDPNPFSFRSELFLSSQRISSFLSCFNWASKSVEFAEIPKLSAEQHILQSFGFGKLAMAFQIEIDWDWVLLCSRLANVHQVLIGSTKRSKLFAWLSQSNNGISICPHVVWVRSAMCTVEVFSVCVQCISRQTILRLFARFLQGPNTN